MMMIFINSSWYSAGDIHLIWTIFFCSSCFSAHKNDIHPKGTNIIMMADYTGWLATTEDDGRWLKMAEDSQQRLF
jgi:hypothetical protein